MKNYTEELKSYWQSADLNFVATLKKVNDNQGFFNHFTNPISKMRLYYPNLDNVEIVDKRVSLFHGQVAGLVDGDFYEVQLAHTNSPKGKNNPYSLKIKNIEKLDQEEINRRLEERNKKATESTRYYGCFQRTSDSFACFENVMLCETGEILMSRGEAQKVFVSPKLSLQQSNYYSFCIKENEGKLPNAIPNTIEEEKCNPYQEYIRLRFERLNNPEANRMIANLMREIGKGMYSSKQRMIFELLQNADDAPGKEKVEFHIDINGDYFFVMHDGAPFNKDDVEAITSAAESTKRGDNKKTGYKGIGFKSVFTDSTEVWIKSGGYQFAFQRNNGYFNDFDKFYFSSERYRKYPDLLEEDKKKYRNQRLRFNGSTDIPWQVIPIWQDFLPREFNDSNFNSFNNPVQFALKLGESNIEEYKLAIDHIAKRPQFLLFLRNTSKFRSPKNGITVLRNDVNQGIEIIKARKGEDNQVFNYTKLTFEDIAVTDTAFTDLNIGLKKQSRINDYNEITYYFTDLEGREIETIPPKLASATATEISFGISLVDNKISSEKDYIQGIQKYSSLFTYLPMEDTRFQLPFLVNADFVPSSDRQKIQGDNLWNQYVMIKVAEMHVATLSHYATEFLKDSGHYNSYLSLLLKNVLPDDDTAQQIINSYNEKYLNDLMSTPVVVNHLNRKQLLKETIIDISGFVELFGADLFYQINNTNKILPHSSLDINFLKKYLYLGVQQVNLEELACKITPDLCEAIGEIIASQSLYNNSELLSWLDKLASYIPDNFGKIPFIVHKGSLFSIESLLKEDEAWIINRNTKEYKSLLEGVGYHIVDLQLEKYQNINNYLNSVNGYINDKSHAYDRLANKPNLPELQTSLKVELIDFLRNSQFMIGIGEKKYFEELRLFVDENRLQRPLRQLLDREGVIEVASLFPYRIHEDEYQVLTSSLKNELIQKGKIFTSFILTRSLFDEWCMQFGSGNIDQYVKDLKLIFSWKEERSEVLQSQWASIPWIYIDDESRFIGCDKVFWSATFDKMSTDHFLSIKNLLHRYNLKLLPSSECGALISFFNLKTDNSPITDWTDINSLDSLAANNLLDWMEVEGTYNSFFEEYTLVRSYEDNWCIVALEDAQVFDGSDSPLKDYINSIPSLNTKFTELPGVLSGESRHKMGVLQGSKLLKGIIDSKLYDQKLAGLLPQKLTWALFHAFISNLPTFELEIDKEYNATSPEHFIINSIVKNVEDVNEVPEEIQKTIDCIRSKIRIDQNPLTHYDLSDIVSFGKGDEKKNLYLSDVLEEFKGESDVLDNIINSFPVIKDKRKLRKLIFRTRRMPYDEICSRIEAEASSYYSVHQVVFQLLYEKFIGIRQWSKQHFDDYWQSQKNNDQIKSGYKSLLDLLLSINFTELEGFFFHDLELKNCVDKNWAIKSEVLPQWLTDWVEMEQEKRLAFISMLGYNGINSPIVKLRKAAISTDHEPNTVIRFFEEAKSNPQIVWNTIEWLSGFSTEKVTRNIALIKEINNHKTLVKDNLKVVTIPIIDSITEEGIRSYKLQSISTGAKLYVLGSEEKLEYSIFNILSRENEKMLFIDSSCGKMTSHFTIEEIKLTTHVDYDLLLKDSKLWDIPYYKKWEHCLKYPIYIYRGNEIPYKRCYGNIPINCFVSDLKVKYDDKYFVSNVLITDILNNLPESFPKDALTSLKEWHYKTLQNEALLDEDSFQYKENIDRILQDRLGLSQEDQKRESGNARAHAIYFLDENGFDVSNIDRAGAALTNIIDPDGNYVSCIVRGAKGGLLYIDKEHWDMLEDRNTYLIVIYPGNSPRLFKSQFELLEEEFAENVLFRIPNTGSTSEIDGVFDALESESHLILVTSEKMKESLFSKLKKKSGLLIEHDVAIGDENFSL